MKTQRIELAERPHGTPTKASFRFASCDLADPQPGEVQVRNRWISIDPAIRGRMFPAKSYVPPFEIGDVIAAPAIGEVTASRDPGFQAGDLVISEAGWCDGANLAADQVQKLPSADLPPQSFLGIAGLTGLTAYAGLLRAARLAPDDVVFVSAAAGGVGSTACLLAKQMGHRVVGSAGGPEKVEFLEWLGVDAAIDYRAVPSLRKALAQAAPAGIDVYFDNAGGPFLEAAIAVANPHARFAICGMISSYNATAPEPAPRNLLLLPSKRIQMTGFLVFDHLDLMPTYLRQLEQWYAAGELRFRETIVEGLDRAPEAFIGLFAGSNVGKMLVHLP